MFVIISNYYFNILKSDNIFNYIILQYFDYSFAFSIPNEIWI